MGAWRKPYTYTERKALTVRPEGLSCFPINRFLFMIMLGTSSRCDFNCQTLQTSPCLHSKDRWCASPFMRLDVLRKSVHHGMANDSDEAVEDVVSVPNEHSQRHTLCKEARPPTLPTLTAAEKKRQQHSYTSQNSLQIQIRAVIGKPGLSHLLQSWKSWKCDISTKS